MIYVDRHVVRYICISRYDIDSWTDRKKQRQTERNRDSQKEIEIDRKKQRYLERNRDRQKEIEIDRKKQRQIERNRDGLK